MERSAYKTKLPRHKDEGEMKRIAHASEPPVVIPVIVVAVDIHIALAVPPVERGESWSVPSLPLPLECSRGCIVFGIVMP